MNEIKTKTKFSCHSLCDRVVLCVFLCADISTISMCEIFLRCNVFVPLYAFRSKDQISIGNCRCKCGSCQGLNQTVELECICFAEIDCVVATNNKAVEAEGLAKPFIINKYQNQISITQHPEFDAVCLNRWVL